MIPISDSIGTGRFPFLNILLILANIFVFFLQMTAPDPEAFVYQYALVPAYINFSDPSTWYPFITSMFLHGDILHIASNMLFLWVFGDNVEEHFGWFFYLPVYLLSGIAGGLLQYMLSPESQIPMLGASGAVAGILGAYYVLLPHSKIKTIVLFFGFFTITEISASFMIGYWFLLQLIAGTFSLGAISQGGIAFWAHVGGFITGVIFAKLLHPKPKDLVYA